MKNPDTNQGLMDHMAGFVEKRFASTGEIIPMWLIQNEDGLIQPVITPFDGEDSKDAIAEAIKEAMKDYGAVRYGFMAETWTIILDKNHPDFNRPDHGGRPSRHRDRRECVTLFVEDNHGKFLRGQFYILRPEHGPAKLSPFEQDEDFDQLGGRFTGLLQKAQ